MKVQKILKQAKERGGAQKFQIEKKAGLRDKNLLVKRGKLRGGGGESRSLEGKKVLGTRVTFPEE